MATDNIYIVLNTFNPAGDTICIIYLGPKTPLIHLILGGGGGGGS